MNEKSKTRQDEFLEGIMEDLYNIDSMEEDDVVATTDAAPFSLKEQNQTTSDEPVFYSKIRELPFALEVPMVAQYQEENFETPSNEHSPLEIIIEENLRMEEEEDNEFNIPLVLNQESTTALQEKTPNEEETKHFELGLPEIIKEEEDEEIQEVATSPISNHETASMEELQETPQHETFRNNLQEITTTQEEFSTSSVLNQLTVTSSTEKIEIPTEKEELQLFELNLPDSMTLEEEDKENQLPYFQVPIFKKQLATLCPQEPQSEIFLEKELMFPMESSQKEQFYMEPLSQHEESPLEIESKTKNIHLLHLYFEECKRFKLEKPNTQIIQIIQQMDIENVEVLDFSRNYLSSKGIFPFLKILQYFTNLRILILKNNGLNNESVVELCQVLKELSLVNLDLSGNKISKSVVPSIVELTDSNKYLIVDVENTRVEKNSF